MARMPFGGLAVEGIREIGYAELKVRNCTSNYSCNTNE